MISRNYTRKALNKALFRVNKKKIVVDYPMTEFRHAIFEVVDKCHLLCDCVWSFDKKSKLTMCNLFYKTKKIECTYNSEDRTVDVDVYYLEEHDGDTVEVLTYATTCDCSTLQNVVYMFQPKKVVVKKHSKKE